MISLNRRSRFGSASRPDLHLPTRVVAPQNVAHPVRVAEELVWQNQVSNVETIIGDFFDATLARKIGPVDLVLSEFVGDQILDEDILRKSYWLRRTYSPRIIPSAIEIFAMPVICQRAVKKVDTYRDNVLELQSVYGLGSGDRLIAY